MITAETLEMPLRRWVPDWVAVVALFVVIIPITMLNGSYTGSMLEVSNTLGTDTSLSKRQIINEIVNRVIPLIETPQK